MKRMFRRNEAPVFCRGNFIFLLYRILFLAVAMRPRCSAGEMAGFSALYQNSPGVAMRPRCSAGEILIIENNSSITKCRNEAPVFCRGNAIMNGGSPPDSSVAMRPRCSAGEIPGN